MEGRDSRDILRTWKEISAHMGANLRTCFRWEKELGLPIHRINKDSPRSSVFAYKSDLDRWLAEKPLSPPMENPAGAPFHRILSRPYLAGGMVVFIIAAAFFLFAPQPGRFSESESLIIAVAPFENLDEPARNAYISEGFTNEIINHLALYEGVRVVPALESAPWESDGGEQPAEPTGRDIPFGPQPDFTLRGALRRHSGNLHLNVQIDRHNDGSRVLDLDFSECSSDPLSAVDTLRKRIDEALGLPKRGRNDSLPQFRFAAPKTKDGEAYDIYLKGAYILGKIGDTEDSEDPWLFYEQGAQYVRQSSREANEAAIRLFHKALELDDAFAHAYIGLAVGYSNYVNFGWDSRMRWLDKAEELLKKAQLLSPNLPEYFSTLIKINLLMDVCFDAGTRHAAYQLAEEGLKHYPHHPRLDSIVGYCCFLKYGEHGDEEDFLKALDFKEKSFQMNPFSFDNLVYTELLMLNGEFKKAADICRLIRRRDPTHMALFRLGEILYYKDDLKAARTIMEQFDTPLNYRIHSLLYLGQIAGRLGDKTAVEDLSARIRRISPGDSRFTAEFLRLASMHLAVGDRENGLRFLERFFAGDLARRTPHIYRRHIAIDRNFDAWRDDPEFREILKKGMSSWPQVKPSGSLLISKSVSRN